MAKLNLSPQQDAIIENASFALPPRERELLRQQVLAEVSTLAEVGDGALWRICAQVQRGLFVPSKIGSHPIALKKIG